VLESRGGASAFFLADIEIASALGAVNFTLSGTRIADENGRTARLVGLMRDTTERFREVRRLTYLATRDELTGQLNRNALREELSQAIESAKAESRNCAFLVASVDRLAMINDSFGFDAGDEVILGVGDRLARSLRSSDVIGRTAGNKFGVLLKNCNEHEIAVVAKRLRAAVRGLGIEHAPDWSPPPARWAPCGCPRPRPPARKPCCALSRPWKRRAPTAAMVSRPTNPRPNAKPCGCARCRSPTRSCWR
jgi:diguanylate cyclase (GGDEF)-like protein